jgi:hypothetical protein
MCDAVGTRCSSPSKGSRDRDDEGNSGHAGGRAADLPMVDGSFAQVRAGGPPFVRSTGNTVKRRVDQAK